MDDWGIGLDWMGDGDGDGKEERRVALGLVLGGGGE